MTRHQPSTLLSLVLCTLLGLAASSLAIACASYGGELQEPGLIEQISYVPGATGSTSGTGISSSGSLVVTSGTVTIPESYGVVISCRHGRFVLNPQSDEAAWVFKGGFKAGDSITIVYREKYVERDGRREVVDLDFIDALKRGTR